MIKKLLIANRGEIAARIIRTCKNMNIETVAVYSEADKAAPFVSMADEAYLLGPARVQDSYLNVDKIFSIAKETGADALHPGYGFLSENPTFREQCDTAGIIFIGPDSQVIQKMGSKIEARRVMKEAGVPIVPGTETAVASPDEAVQFAEHIGYPILLKASSGGGGIGMQTVYSAEELIKAFDGNQKRAQTFFGDGSMFLEKKIEAAHHVEIQLLADEHGHVVHLFDRECSIQRRNQKVIEEASSPFISDETRQAMGKAAVKAAQAIGYTNAGTIEFLVDDNEQFYFLEMNTRIQVEHPVTEEITGIDIVEAQIHIANGEKLAFEQTDIKKTGHAIEARIYAEDPVTFFPSPGTITKLELPEGIGVRHDIGVVSGSQVTPFYDPMIGKLIVSGDTRDEAISRLEKALDAYQIEGIKTNIPMLKDVIEHPLFKAGQTTTAFVELFYQSIKK
ncbi:acetyl-CoA carboxylase biotin carboxylase subunit [Lentibacillus saliphilus]|uniref:acetyl-CoA carboxylase biotin carboxylase subunit n=1 Tax=Lentibacillus saliphilus TaxID=2737028 RepID=UPI001C2F9545